MTFSICNLRLTELILIFRCPIPCFSMEWGRIDVADCSDDGTTFPSPAMTGSEMFEYFDKEFGFSEDQVTSYDECQLQCDQTWRNLATLTKCQSTFGNFLCVILYLGKFRTQFGKCFMLLSEFLLSKWPNMKKIM